MIKIVKHISVDVASENIFQSIVAKQYDTDSRFLKVRLTNEGKQINVQPTSVVIINALREDDEAQGFAGTVNDDGTVTVPITSWMLELDGKVECDISVINTEQRKLTSTSFTIMVEAATYAGTDIAEDDNYDVLVNLIAKCSEATAAALQAAESIASGEVLAASLEKCANALKGNASGNIVALKDVSPLQHNIKVQLDNGESVTVRSKNLFDKSKSLIDGIKNETAISGKYQTVFNYTDLVRNLKPNVKYTLSYEVECLSVPESAKNAVKMEQAVGLALRLKGGSAFVLKYRLMEAGEILKVSNTFTLTEEQYNSENLEMLAYCNGYTVDNVNYEFSTEIIRNIQIEEGATATDYEPYIEPITYTADENGELAIPSMYPSMTIVADEGATMSVEYNRDINKCEFGGTPNLDNYYTKNEIDGLVGDIETLLGGI